MDRFKAMEEEEQRGEFRGKLSGYVKVYSFLSQIIPYGDPDLEMLYSFGRFLLPHLTLERDTSAVKLGDEVGLQYYRLGQANPFDKFQLGLRQMLEDLMIQRMRENEQDRLALYG